MAKTRIKPKPVKKGKPKPVDHGPNNIKPVEAGKMLARGVAGGAASAAAKYYMTGGSFMLPATTGLAAGIGITAGSIATGILVSCAVAILLNRTQDWVQRMKAKGVPHPKITATISATRKKLANPGFKAKIQQRIAQKKKAVMVKKTKATVKEAFLNG